MTASRPDDQRGAAPRASNLRRRGHVTNIPSQPPTIGVALAIAKRSPRPDGRARQVDLQGLRRRMRLPTHRSGQRGCRSPSNGHSAIVGWRGTQCRARGHPRERDQVICRAPIPLRRHLPARPSARSSRLTAPRACSELRKPEPHYGPSHTHRRLASISSSPLRLMADRCESSRHAGSRGRPSLCVLTHPESWTKPRRSGYPR